MIKYEELNLKDLNQYDSIISKYSTTKKYEITKINRGLGGFKIDLIDVELYEKTFEGNSNKWLSYFNDLSNFTKRGTISHEFGHCMGLAHSTNPNRVMCTAETREVASPSYVDLDTINHLYD